MRLALLIPLLLAGCGSADRPAEKKAAASDPVKITQFYAPAAFIARGESINLCYGVDNAVAVRIDPPVEKLGPALSRCFPVSPPATTTYTLTAEDRGGKTASQSVTITVTGSRPKFNDLAISAKEVKPGERVQFCFKATGAASVSGSPGKFLSGGSPNADCLVDNPRQTTTYKLIITGAGGLTDQDSVTVTVR